MRADVGPGGATSRQGGPGEGLAFSVHQGKLPSSLSTYSDLFLTKLPSKVSFLMLDSKFACIGIMFVVGELIATLLFAMLRRVIFEPSEIPKNVVSATLKGVLERVVLFVGLYFGFQSILIAFAAIRLATRLGPQAKSDASNEFFLVGSLTSFLITFIYIIVATAYIK